MFNLNFTICRLKRLVREDQFLLVKRKARHASPVTRSLAKVIVANLTIDDFVKEEEDRNFPNEFVWIYETEFGIKYYLKFKFINDFTQVLFISFSRSTVLGDD